MHAFSKKEKSDPKEGPAPTHSYRSQKEDGKVRGNSTMQNPAGLQKKGIVQYRTSVR